MSLVQYAAHALEAAATAAGCVVILEAAYRYATRRLGGEDDT